MCEHDHTPTMDERMYERVRPYLAQILPLAEGHIDYPKLLQVVIEHFIRSEGTDYLGSVGKVELYQANCLSPAELNVLRKIRDKARKAVGWEGY